MAGTQLSHPTDSGTSPLGGPKPAFSIRVGTLNIWGLPDWLTKGIGLVPYLEEDDHPLMTSSSSLESGSKSNDVNNKPKRSPANNRGRKKVEVASHDDRLNHIIDGIKQLNVDVVAFQEVWLKSDVQFLSSAHVQQATGLKYSKFYESSLVGSGLIVLSRYPIISTNFYPYSLNGKPQRLLQGDYWAGKGLAHAKIELPNNESLDYYFTHAIARYGEIDEFHIHRIVQCYEMLNIIRSTHTSSLVLLGGDLNMVPSSIEYGIISEVGKMIDTYATIHPHADPADSATHTFDVFTTGAKRLDYIFQFPTVLKSKKEAGSMWKVVDSMVTLKEEISGKKVLVKYSDHYLVVADFTLQPPPKPASSPSLMTLSMTPSQIEPPSSPRAPIHIHHDQSLSTSIPSTSSSSPCLISVSIINNEDTQRRQRTHHDDSHRTQMDEKSLSENFVHHQAYAALSKGIVSEKVRLRSHYSRALLALSGWITSLFLMYFNQSIISSSLPLDTMIMMSGASSILWYVVIAILGIYSFLEAIYAFCYKRREVQTLKSSLLQYCASHHHYYQLHHQPRNHTASLSSLPDFPPTSKAISAK